MIGWSTTRPCGDHESLALLRWNGQAEREALGHRVRRAAHACLELAHSIGGTADLVRELILGEIERATAAAQPRAEKRVAVLVGLLGLVVRHFVPLSVDQTMTTG
jgi:hypothetical protein